MTENTPNTGSAAPATEGHDDPFAPVALLAGLTGITGDNANQMRLLRIITDPNLSNDTVEGGTPMEIADHYEEEFSDYLDWNYNSQIEIVADFLYAHYGASDQPDFTFGFACNSEGEVGGVTVTACFGENYYDSVRAHQFLDIKHTTYDREAKGLAAALAIAEALDSTYQSLVDIGRKRGLLTAPSNVVEQAVAALTAYDAVPEDEDVDVDTMASLRDALAAMLTAQAALPTPAAADCGNPSAACTDHHGTCD